MSQAPKDIIWRKISNETYIQYPFAELLIKTSITIRQTWAHYLETRNFHIEDRLSREEVTHYSFLNHPEID